MISTGCFYALQMSFRRIFMIRLAVFSASHAMGGCGKMPCTEQEALKETETSAFLKK